MKNQYQSETERELLTSLFVFGGKRDDYALQSKIDWESDFLFEGAFDEKGEFDEELERLKHQYQTIASRDLLGAFV